MGVSVKITKNEFANAGVQAGVRKSIIVACTKVTAQAKSLTPVDNGQLRNSIMWKVSGDNGGFNEGGAGRATGGFKRKSKKIEATNAPPEDKISLRTYNRKQGLIQEGYVGTNSDHWYPEFGTRHQRAQPFLRPAKELVMDGGKAAAIGVKYGREEMEKEYRKRKTTTEVKNG